MTTEYYPMQPLVEENGVLRFERNPIVEMLVGRFGMNEIAIWCAHREMNPKYQEQLAQLIGYSTFGYTSLDYVSDESQIRVERAIQAFNDRLNGGLGALSHEEVANNLRVCIGLWDPVEVYVRKHPSVKLGVSVPEAALRLLQEGDEAAKKLAAEHDARVLAEQALELADRLNEELIEQVATLKEYEQSHEKHVVEIRNLEEHIRSIAEHMGVPPSAVPYQTKNRIMFALTQMAEILSIEKLNPDNVKHFAGLDAKHAGLNAKYADLQTKYAEALREKQAAVDRYQRDVYGLNNEGDPIGGEPAGGYANELKACREELEKLRAKEFVDFVRDGESAYLVKANPAAAAIEGRKPIGFFNSSRPGYIQWESGVFLTRAKDGDPIYGSAPSYTPVVAVPDDVVHAIYKLDRSIYKHWAKEGVQRDGYVASNVNTKHLVKVVEWVREIASAQYHSQQSTQHITEKDAKTIAQNYKSWREDREIGYLITPEKWFESVGRDLLSKLNADRCPRDGQQYIVDADPHENVVQAAVAEMTRPFAQLEEHYQASKTEAAQDSVPVFRRVVLEFGEKLSKEQVAEIHTAISSMFPRVMHTVEWF